MAIEVDEKRLLKQELSSVLDNIFISNEDFTDKHMDFGHIDGVLFVGEKEKKIPFFKFKQLKDRQLLRKDFSDFLKSFHIDSYFFKTVQKDSHSRSQKKRRQ